MLYEQSLLGIIVGGTLFPIKDCWYMGDIPNLRLKA